VDKDQCYSEKYPQLKILTSEN